VPPGRKQLRQAQQTERGPHFLPGYLASSRLDGHALISIYDLSCMSTCVYTSALSKRAPQGGEVVCLARQRTSPTPGLSPHTPNGCRRCAMSGSIGTATDLPPPPALCCWPEHGLYYEAHLKRGGSKALTRADIAVDHAREDRLIKVAQEGLIPSCRHAAVDSVLGTSRAIEFLRTRCRRTEQER